MNHLANEKSPYLQQHAHNPVEWYPWGEEAFERARREDKPIFLSIGYSTCHWCHVMAHESFEDEETARVMNELFVNIKVDREERPDVDHVYMTAAQAISGSGGWPLSAWLTPDLKPFYVGTYFPPRAAYGRSSFRNVLEQLHDAWVNDREKLLRSAHALVGAVKAQSTLALDNPDGVIDFTIIDRCFDQLQSSYDAEHGGFGRAPKFPRPAIFEFLLRYHIERQNDDALAMTAHTLRTMSSGGMYDQLGGGFARYSVDAFWRVPHFEKMLYDQGQLLAVFADAYRITKDVELARTMRQTIAYLERDLMSPAGMFYSAEDADSEGEEGTFYVWTVEQLREALDANQFEVVRRYYGITDAGNFEHGKNVLHTSATIEAVAADLNMSADDVTSLLSSAKRKLFELRAKRIRPHRDEKILTSWNGLVISGLAKAAAALGEPHFAHLAARAADLILQTMVVDGRLMRRLKDDEVKFDAYLDDYAFLAQALLDLYETTFDVTYLKEAERLTREAIAIFHDAEHGGFFMSADGDATVLVRSKGDYDGAEPAGNSIMAMNLLRLGRLFYNEELTSMAEETIRLFTDRIARYPMAMPMTVAAALALSHAPRQIVIAASSDRTDTARLIHEAQSDYRPDTALVLINADGADPWLIEKMPTIEGMGPVDNEAAAYVCENFVCMRPVKGLGARD